MVEFVSYDGKYPNLCSGILVLRIDGETIEFPKYCMNSCGYAGLDENRNERITSGPWYVDVPEKYTYFKEEIEECVNEHVTWGCCGGCI